METALYRTALIVVALAAVGALLTNGDLEVTFFMVGAVVAGLVCFDTALERAARSFAPWLFLSLAPAMKTVPSVWQELRSESGALFEPFDHTGSLLFGLCVAGAVISLSRPSRDLGRSASAFDAGAILGAAVAAGLSGASVAFLFDAGFGTEKVGRLIETPTWAVIGAVLAATMLAASHVPRLTAPLVGVLAGAGASAGLLAFSLAGRAVDRGWWAVLFALFAWSAAAFGHGVLGERADRTRRSIVGVVVVLSSGVVAAAAAISARSDREAWEPGWVLLGVVALALFALAMASPPADEHDEAQSNATTDLALIERAATEKANALLALRSAVAAEPRSARPVVAASESASGAGMQRPVVAASESASGAGMQRPVVAASESASGAGMPRPVAAASESVSEAGMPRPVVAASESVSEAGMPRPVVAAASKSGANAAKVRQVDTTASSRTSLSSATTVATARAQAEARGETSVERNVRAPLAQAHHFDPSTGLLSASGLQDALGQAFSTRRQAGQVTIMMITIRDLDGIELERGRLASAAVTREIAQRVRRLLPEGTGARFARSAYAILLTGDQGDPNQTIQRLARVLLKMRAPIDDGSSGTQIDVVAGMAQCYAGEDAAQFVRRANLGLARAVQTAEPTLVAMP